MGAAKMGCSDTLLNDLVLEIHHRVKDLNSTINLVYVNTKEQLADEPSRMIDKNEEIFNPEIFQTLQGLMGTPFEYDCLATSENRLVEKFVSKSFGDDTDKVDFLTLTNLEGPLWIFPPKCLAKNVANHIVEHYKHTKWTFIAHRWLEWFPGYLKFMQLPTTVFIKLSTREQPCTALPVHKKNETCWHPYYKPNKIAAETWAVLNFPHSDFKLENKFLDLKYLI